MHWNVCKHCHKVFYDRFKVSTCKDCKPIDDELFERIEAYLRKYPNSNALQIAEGLEVSVNLVTSFIDEGRLTIVNGKWSKET